MWAARAARGAGLGALAVWKRGASVVDRGWGKGQEGPVSASPAASTEASASLFLGACRLPHVPSCPMLLASATATRLKTVLGLSRTSLRTRKLYHLDLGVDGSEAAQVLQALVDPVSEVGALGCLPDPDDALLLSVGFRPG